METGKLKLALSAGALALSMALAGCGGSSSSGGVSANTDNENNGNPSATGAVSGVPSGTTFTEADFPLTIMPGEDKEQDGVTFSCPSTASSSCMVTLEDNVASGTGGVTAAATVMTRNSRQNEAANLIRAAIADKSGFARPTPEFAASGITVNRFGGDAAINLGSSKSFAPDTTNPAPSAVTGWMGQAFSYAGTGDNPSPERVVVYTNKEKATDVDFVGSASTDLAMVAGNAITAVPDTGIVQFADGSGSIHEEHFGGDFKLPDPNSQGDSMRPMPTGAAGEKGTFYGVPGKFICASTTCTITRTETGQISFSGGNLTFDPAEDDQAELAKLKAKYADQDDTYVSFGYWSQTVTTDGTTKRTFKTFAEGRPNADGHGLAIAASSIQGSATYSGAAAGWFARWAGTDTYGGPFTATAKLTATFGDATPAITDSEYDVEGMITNFQGAGVDSTWALKLEKVKLYETGGDLSDHTNIEDFTGGTTASTGVQGGGAKGTWSGSFYGNGTGANGNRPTDVSGEFTGNFRNGQVAGAFGASHQ